MRSRSFDEDGADRADQMTANEAVAWSLAKLPYASSILPTGDLGVLESLTLKW